jgi:NADPH2:quinone reductase
VGAEGCGTIEEIGSGVDQNLRGKKVAFCYGGWTQYTVQDADNVLLFDDQVDLRKCANAFVNPMTALCMKQCLLDKGAKSVVYLGASSNLGRMFVQLAQKDLEVIAIVSNDE